MALVQAVLRAVPELHRMRQHPETGPARRARHRAPRELGLELRTFAGKFDGDIKPEAHPKNLDLAEWWASMIEIPCIVMGGTDPASALAVAETGAEFVALRAAIFDEQASAARIVAEVNALLDEKAPRFGD